MTMISLLLGLSSAASLLFGKPGMGLFFWILTRVADGLDGAIARIMEKSSELGGYLDIMSDFLVYAAIPIAFAVHTSDSATLRAAMLLLDSFYINAASWMYLAALLEKRGHPSSPHGGTSVTMPEGIIGGTETLLFFTLFFLLPRFLIFLFSFMAAMTLVSALQRLIWAFRKL